MNELKQMQQRWLAGLLTPELAAATVTAELEGGLRTPEAAFALYVNSIRAALKSSLEASFPATMVALEMRFNALLPELLAAQPPVSSDLSRYDATFVAWLAHINHDAADLARFEWLTERTRRSRLLPALSAIELAQHPGKVRLNQHLLLFATERRPPVPVMGAHFWALAGGDAPQQRPLTRAEYAFLRGLEGEGMTLLDALRAALFVDEHFVPLPILQWLVVVQGLVAVGLRGALGSRPHDRG